MNSVARALDVGVPLGQLGREGAAGSTPVRGEVQAQGLAFLGQVSIYHNK